MDGKFEVEKLTELKWSNLYNIKYSRKNAVDNDWVVCSRKENAVIDADKSDAVYIIPILNVDGGDKLVLTKEFRVPIWDYEYGFPGGLIDEGDSVEVTVERELKEETGLDVEEILHVSGPVYSSAGLTDESCNMAIVRASGKVTDEYLEKDEDIEAVLFDVEQIKELLASDKKISAKAWGILYMVARSGKIEL